MGLVFGCPNIGSVNCFPSDLNIVFSIAPSIANGHQFLSTAHHIAARIFYLASREGAKSSQGHPIRLLGLVGMVEECQNHRAWRHDAIHVLRVACIFLEVVPIVLDSDHRLVSERSWEWSSNGLRLGCHSSWGALRVGVEIMNFSLKVVRKLGIAMAYVETLCASGCSAVMVPEGPNDHLSLAAKFIIICRGLLLTSCRLKLAPLRSQRVPLIDFSVHAHGMSLVAGGQLRLLGLR